MNIQECIFFQLAKAAQSGTRFWAACVNPYNVTPAQAMVLNFLRQEDRITARELGQRTFLDSATLTGVLDRLEAAGHIRRMAHPQDRRAHLIVLTESGKNLAQRLFEQMIEANQQFLQPLDEAEQHELKKLLTRLRSSAGQPSMPNNAHGEES